MPGGARSGFCCARSQGAVSQVADSGTALAVLHIVETIATNTTQCALLARALGLLVACWLSALGLPACACAIAFTSGVSPGPTPEHFLDTDTSSMREERKWLEATGSTAPIFGLSLVVGGNVMDSGALPSPFFPVVLLP